MRALALVLAFAATAQATPRVTNRAGVSPHADRTDRRQVSGSSDAALLRILPATASIPGGECSGQDVTGSLGQSLTFSRSGSANCQKADGTWVSVGNNQMRASSKAGFPALLLEGAASNVVHYSRDMSQSSDWTVANGSCSHNATGIDGATNSASTCTASASFMTVAQTLSRATFSALSSVFVKRVSGTGTISITRNNFSSTTTLNSSNCRNMATDAAQAPNSSNWVRCYFFTASSPAVLGIRVDTSGDSILLDGWQDEAYNNVDGPSSPIFTTSTGQVRNADSLTFSNPTGMSNTAGCIAAKGYKTSLEYGGANPRMWDTGNNGYTVFLSNAIYTQAGSYSAFDYVSPTILAGLDVVSKWTGSTLSVSVNQDGPTSATYGGTILGSAIRLGTDTSGTNGFNGWVGNIRVGASPGDCAQ
jgi:hypothetical protein